MQLLHLLVGSITVEPGTNVSRILDLPVTWQGSHASWALSRVETTDPTNATLFKVISIYDYTPQSGVSQFIGAQQVAIIYTLTGTNAISVDLNLVFTDEQDPSGTSYAGG